VVPGEACPTSNGSSISGLDFNPAGSPLPAEFDGALFFADYSRRCMWVMEKNGGAAPSPSRIRIFRAGAANPVDVQFGPRGDIFYADLKGGTIKRIHYTAGNQAPRAVASAGPTNGPTPLTVSFDARASSDPDPGDTLSYAWDLNGDGAFDDGAGAQASFTYNTAGSYAARVKVTDNHGASATDTVAITAGNTPPTPTIAAPTEGLTWKVGDSINFRGSAVDDQDGTLPASALSWSLTLFHCPSNCHTHSLQSFSATSSGSFPAPDHDYPSYLELRLTATDSGGLTASRTVRLDPRTVPLVFNSVPPGLQLAINGASSATPFTRTVIEGSRNTLSAPTPQTLGPVTHDFKSWSDGGAATHSVVANQAATYTATYQAR
jgi:PKD repeat protein